MKGFLDCMVEGCNQNSRISSHFKFFTMPKDEERAKLWIKAAGKGDQLDYFLDHKRKRYFRICSKHFFPTSIRNNRLADDAIPRLNLPGQDQQDNVHHHGVVCNKCDVLISDCRYKCMTCTDFDLCRECESTHEHDHHIMIRIAKPLPAAEVEYITSKFQSVLSQEEEADKYKDMQNAHVISSARTLIEVDCDSSDDEPIKKYQNINENAIELSEAEKKKISAEVNRVVRLLKRKKSQDKGVSRKKIKKDSGNQSDLQSSSILTQAELQSSLLEVEFADVNDFESDLKVKVI